MDSAKTVTFDERTDKKSVTLDGDSFDPAGTLTEGARVQASSVLLSLAELNDASNALHAAQQKLQQVENQLSAVKPVAAKWRELKQQYDLESHDAKLLSDGLKQSGHGQQLEINQLEATIAEQEKVLKNAAETKKKSTVRVADLEDKLKNSKTVREREVKQAQKEVDQAKKRYDLGTEEILRPGKHGV